MPADSVDDPWPCVVCLVVLWWSGFVVLVCVVFLVLFFFLLLLLCCVEGRGEERRGERHTEMNCLLLRNKQTNKQGDGWVAGVNVCL